MPGTFDVDHGDAVAGTARCRAIGYELESLHALEAVVIRGNFRAADCSFCGQPIECDERRVQLRLMCTRARSAANTPRISVIPLSAEVGSISGAAAVVAGGSCKC